MISFNLRTSKDNNSLSYVNVAKKLKKKLEAKTRNFAMPLDRTKIEYSNKSHLKLRNPFMLLYRLPPLPLPPPPTSLPSRNRLGSLPYNTHFYFPDSTTTKANFPY